MGKTLPCSTALCGNCPNPHDHWCGCLCGALCHMQPWLRPQRIYGESCVTQRFVFAIHALFYSLHVLGSIVLNVFVCQAKGPHMHIGDHICMHSSVCLAVLYFSIKSLALTRCVCCRKLLVDLLGLTESCQLRLRTVHQRMHQRQVLMTAPVEGRTEAFGVTVSIRLKMLASEAALQETSAVLGKTAHQQVEVEAQDNAQPRIHFCWPFQ